ncbi:MAG: DUF4139 domain-containing protein [Bacteroidia bacterium]|nr:DUF4139 domain-containing protein [Bacteroidia bacterium]
MRKVFLILTFISTLFEYGLADEIEKKVQSKITGVTVFMQGAQIARTGTTTIPKGTSVVVFEGVSPYLNQQSIKASGKGSFTIMDVRYRYVYPEPVEEDTRETDRIQKKIDRLNDSLSDLNLRIYNIQEKKTGIRTEKNLLLNHPLMTGKGKPDSLALLIGTLDYIEVKLQTLADRALKISIVEAKMLKQRQAMSKRLNDLQLFIRNQPRPEPNKPKHQVLVAVMAKAQTTAKLEINYKVNRAGWSPWYDITAKDAGDDIELVYKAAVYQNTGVDWKNVKLRISNANPNQSNVKPVLPRWYIDYYRHQAERRLKKTPNRYFESRTDAVAEDEAEVADVEILEDKDASMAYDFSQKMQNFSSIEFDIDLPYYIKSNAKTHFVTVQKHNLAAKFHHYIVPKLDKDAFVIAQITDWENLDLLVGSANIYFGNTFIGRTVIDPSIVTDTLEVSMGRYRSLAVKRTKLKTDTRKQIVGAHKVYTATYKIELRNNSANPIELTLEDQIPLTRNQDIEIELTKPDGGKLNELTGLISWDMKLDPYKKKTITFTYTVKYPKEQEITGL